MIQVAESLKASERGAVAISNYFAKANGDRNIAYTQPKPAPGSAPCKTFYAKTSGRQNMFVANLTDGPAYVFVYLDPAWQVADLVVNVVVTVATTAASLATAGAAVAGLPAAANGVSAAIKSFQAAKTITNLIKILKTTWGVVSKVKGIYGAGAKPAQAYEAFSKAVADVESEALYIKKGWCANIFQSQAHWQEVFSVSGAAGLFGAKTMKVNVVNEGEKELRFKEFGAHNDSSWVLDNEMVWRQKYGKALYVKDSNKSRGFAWDRTPKSP
ncbi:hypothetical protein ACH4YO_42820 [Streptomyces noursei]|uniref:hypothetical protein n=1 Tax=Streptomyces noursei TaxID=1971 RepID=UPI0033CD12B6